MVDLTAIAVPTLVLNGEFEDRAVSATWPPSNMEHPAAFNRAVVELLVDRSIFPEAE